MQPSVPIPPTIVKTKPNVFWSPLSNTRLHHNNPKNKIVRKHIHVNLKLLAFEWDFSKLVFAIVYTSYLNAIKAIKPKAATWTNSPK